jgi:hypothetical protein
MTSAHAADAAAFLPQTCIYGSDEEFLAKAVPCIDDLPRGWHPLPRALHIDALGVVPATSMSAFDHHWRGNV